jgi:hypothetical protein
VADIFEDRRRALEEAFFQKQNKQVLDRLKAEAQRQSAKQAIAEATGVRDDAVLTRLADLGFDASSLVAFSLVPAVEVAWADGDVDAAERSEILATIAKNVAVGTPAYQMIEAWLTRRPGPEVFAAWVDYTRALVAKLSPNDREWVRSTVVGSAEATAKASGGLLGIALKKSRAEGEVLKKVHAAFAV